MHKIILVAMVMLIIPFSLAVSINNPNLPLVNTPTSTATSSVNYSTINVNNSDFLDGFDSSYFYPYSNPLNFINVSTSPGGSNTNVQYNDGGSFGGDGNFTYNKTDNMLKVIAQSTTYTIGNVASGTETLDYGGSYFQAYGWTYSFDIYAYKTIGAERVYSTTALSLSQTDDGSYNYFDILLDWDDVAGADGYRVIITQDDWDGFSGNYYFDVDVSSATYVSGVSILPGNTVTPKTLTTIVGGINTTGYTYGYQGEYVNKIITPEVESPNNLLIDSNNVTLYDTLGIGQSPTISGLDLVGLLRLHSTANSYGIDLLERSGNEGEQAVLRGNKGTYTLINFATLGGSATDRKYAAFAFWDVDVPNFNSGGKELQIFIQGTSNEADIFTTRVGGSGVTDPNLRIQAGRDHLNNWMFFAGNNLDRIGVETDTPDRLFDLESSAEPQLRLTYSNNASYTDFRSGLGGNLEIYPSGSWVNITKGLQVDNNIQLKDDSDKIYFGSARDASITYDGVNMIINPKEVGTGKVSIEGSLNVTDNLYVGNDVNITNNFKVYGNVSFKIPVWSGYDNSTQTLLSVSNAQVINISNNDDIKSYLISVVGNQNLTFNKAGYYSCILSPEFYEPLGQSGIVTFWYQKNGQDVLWDNSRYTLPSNFYSAPLIEFTFNIENPATDNIRFMWWSDNANTILYSSGALTSPTRPSIPAIMLNCKWISDVI